MSTENAVSDANQVHSVNPDQKDTVSYDTYRRVLSEAKKLKDQLKLVEDEKNKSHENKLREQNEWKSLADSKTARVSELESLLKEQNDQIVNGIKYQEFEKHLGGKLKNKDYATFIEFDKIVLNPETRRVDEQSVKEVAASFIKQHPTLVEFQNTGRMPNEASTHGRQLVKSPESMTTAELEEEIKKMGKL